MITEIVTFSLPAEMDRQTVIGLFQQTVPRWQSERALIRKQYLYDADQSIGGGVYLWTDIDAAQKAHDAAWCAKAESLYGSAPAFQYFETPIVVDNAADTVLGAAPD